MRLLRSWLFAPGDSEKKLGKAVESRADAVILDLEDSVAPGSKPAARALLPGFLRAHPSAARGPQLWVRINPLSSGLALEDLIAVVPGVPDGIVLPKAQGPEDVLTLTHYLDALEAQHGLAAGTIQVLPIASETARAVLRLASYAETPLARLAGITWGAEDLSVAVGATTNLDASGEWAFTYQLARSLTLLAAHAAGAQAIDTLYVNYKDEAGLAVSSRASHAAGFSGRLAIHPAQVDPINECYRPSPQQLQHAQAVIAAFEAARGGGAVGLNGRMLDVPHLKQAQALIAAAAAHAKGGA